MKVHRIELLVVDHDGLGAAEIAVVLQNARYPNHCIAPRVMATETKDIGKWSDDHPLNQRDRIEAEYRKLFP